MSVQDLCDQLRVYVFMHTGSIFMCLVYVCLAGNASSAWLLVGLGDREQQQPCLSSSCWTWHDLFSSKNPVPKYSVLKNDKNMVPERLLF